MRRFFQALLSDTRGTSSLEYAFLCAMIVIAIVGSISGLGDANSGYWAKIESKAAEAHKR